MQTTDHFSYDEYDRLTRAYANEHGGVNYSGLKKEMAALEEFIDQLAAASPENKPEWFPNEDERKRYYLTAHNAYLEDIRLVRRRLPQLPASQARICGAARCSVRGVLPYGLRRRGAGKSRGYRAYDQVSGLRQRAQRGMTPPWPRRCISALCSLWLRVSGKVPSHKRTREEIGVFGLRISDCCSSPAQSLIDPSPMPRFDRD